MATDTAFELVFSDLQRMGEIRHSAKRTFELLKELEFGTPKSQSDTLISELNNIRYASNTNSCFYFYFPIISHILYYKPEYEKEILKYLVEPNFANGTTDTKDIIAVIIGAMQYKMKENEYYLTKESQFWVLNELPKLELQVEREINSCWKELDA
jgi:hypothetical protein